MIMSFTYSEPYNKPHNTQNKLYNKAYKAYNRFYNKPTNTDNKLYNKLTYSETYNQRHNTYNEPGKKPYNTYNTPYKCYNRPSFRHSSTCSTRTWHLNPAQNYMTLCKGLYLHLTFQIRNVHIRNYISRSFPKLRNQMSKLK